MARSSTNAPSPPNRWLRDWKDNATLEFPLRTNMMPTQHDGNNSRNKKVKLAIGATSVVALVALSILLFAKAYYVCFLPDRGTVQLLLWQTPLGSTVGEVEKWLAAKQLPFESFSVGFNRREKPDDTIVGVKSIEAKMGNCISIILFDRIVVATWAFDENDRLVDIWVRSYVDAL